MATQNKLKQHILATLDTLPEQALEEVVTYLDYLQYKLSQHPRPMTPYQIKR